jgi:Tfp pilus assembly protein PilW
MVCSNTSTKRTCSGVALADLLIGTALASVALLLVCTITIYAGRSFAALVNYVSLDQESRNALDKMSKEIRQCNRLVDAGSNYLSFQDYDGGTLTYSYSPSTKLLTRSKNGVSDARPLLEKCSYLNFAIFQRNPIGGTYEQYPAGDTNTCKLVQLSWICSRPILGSTQNTESVQSAKVVIRKQ